MAEPAAHRKGQGPSPLRADLATLRISPGNGEVSFLAALAPWILVPSQVGPAPCSVTAAIAVAAASLLAAPVLAAVAAGGT